MSLTRDDCRKCFKDSGLSYEKLDDADIAALLIMLNGEMRRCRRQPTGSFHKTWRMSSRTVIKHDTRGRIKAAFLRFIPYPGCDREAVSFNAGGFIGFCGDSDDHNAESILRTFVARCKILAEVDG